MRLHILVAIDINLIFSEPYRLIAKHSMCVYFSSHNLTLFCLYSISLVSSSGPVPFTFAFNCILDGRRVCRVFLLGCLCHWE